MTLQSGGLEQVLDITTIKALALIAQNGSVTQTAEVLGYSQPAISQRIGRAEEKLGLSLTRRQGNTVALTEAGEVIAEASPPIEAALEDVRLGLVDLTTLRSGSLTLSGFPSASATLIPILLSNLRATRPGLSISYLEAEPSEAHQLLRNRRIDAAIVCTYPGQGDSLGNTAQRLPLFRDPLHFIMPTSHPLAGEPTIDVTDFKDDDWIAGCTLCRGYTTITCEKRGFTPRITLATDNFAAVVGFVSRGMGVAIVPALVLRTVALPASVAVRKLAQPSNRIIELVADQSVSHEPALRAMARLLAALDTSVWGLHRIKA